MYILIDHRITCFYVVSESYLLSLIKQLKDFFLIQQLLLSNLFTIFTFFVADILPHFYLNSVGHHLISIRDASLGFRQVFRFPIFMLHLFQTVLA